MGGGEGGTSVIIRTILILKKKYIAEGNQNKIAST